MVRDGMAWAFVRYSSDYAALEREARAARRGVFAAENTPPWEFRADACAGTWSRRSRPQTGRYPCPEPRAGRRCCDATYVKVRQAGRIVSVAVIVAVGVTQITCSGLKPIEERRSFPASRNVSREEIAADDG